MLLFSPFRALIFAAVVPNRPAIAASVSPFLTLYVVRKAGDGFADTAADGSGVRVALGVGREVGVATTAALDGSADDAAGPPPLDSRVSATTAKATTMSPMRAS